MPGSRSCLCHPRPEAPEMHGRSCLYHPPPEVPEMPGHWSCLCHPPPEVPEMPGRSCLCHQHQEVPEMPQLVHGDPYQNLRVGTVQGPPKKLQSGSKLPSGLERSFLAQGSLVDWVTSAAWIYSGTSAKSMKERRKPFLVILVTVKTAFPDGQDCKNMSKTDMSSTGGYRTFLI